MCALMCACGSDVRSDVCLWLVAHRTCQGTLPEGQQLPEGWLGASGALLSPKHSPRPQRLQCSDHKLLASQPIITIAASLMTGVGN